MQNVRTTSYVKRICAKSLAWYEMTVVIIRSVHLKNIIMFAIANRGILVIQSKDVHKLTGVHRILVATARNVKIREIGHNVFVLRELLEIRMKKNVERLKNVGLTKIVLQLLGVLLLTVLENVPVSFLRSLLTVHIKTA